MDEGSPAALAGVQADDLIVAVNGQPSAPLKMKSVREALRAGEGKKISLEVKRGERTFPVEFALKRLL